MARAAVLAQLVRQQLMYRLIYSFTTWRAVWSCRAISGNPVHVAKANVRAAPLECSAALVGLLRVILKVDGRMWQSLITQTGGRRDCAPQSDRQ